MINKLFYILLFAFTINSFSQVITIDTTSYTIPELVNKVLINSSCIQTFNIKWKTGTNYGSSNGIGYFESKNPNFPIKNGVILSTGNIKNAPGPNNSVQNEGSPAWLGDSDLENTMANAGIPMVSTNATVLEFDFMPISSKFSFDFLFASEEYGNSQCNFSDSFAYLLTNSTTGVTTNLAVVPSTNSPISVYTVRDNAFNSKCSSENSQYFDNYYGGAIASSAATNFNGNTIKMTASAVLTPNIMYHIKLVIADSRNSILDSAIFLSSQNFNLSQEVLGPDYRVLNNNAICVGSTPPDLDTGLDPSIYSFSWRKNGNLIADENQSKLSGITAGVYSVTYTNFINICQPITDTILIENYPEIVAGNPNDIYKCDLGQSSYDYNLELNTPILLKDSGSPLIAIGISYHISLSDAEDGINPLPNIFNSHDGVTIYARVTNQINLCYIIKSFKLLITPTPTANKPKDITKCSVSSKISFNLASTKPEILNGQSSIINTITYYKSQNEADVGVGLLNENDYNTAGSETIYTRIQNKDDATCYSTTNFKVFVDIIPRLDTINPKFVCNSFVLKTLAYGNYYDGLDGTGKQYFAGDIITMGSIDPTKNIKTLYIYDPTLLCTPIPQNKVVITFVDLNLITPKSGTYCSNIGYVLPPLEYGKYYSAPGGPTGNGEVIPFGTLITTPQTIYTYYKSPSTPSCVTFSSFVISIIDSPVIPVFENVYDCTSYTLAPLNSGNYYDQPNGLGNIIAAGTVITSTQTIYIYSKTVNSNCSESKTFTVYIGSFPHPTDSINCINNTLPSLPVGNYYTGPGGTGTLIKGNTIINTTTTLYIYVPADTNSNCPSLDIPFTIAINLPPISNPNDDTISYCESYKLLPLVNGNYYANFDGKSTLLNAGYEVKTTLTIYISISIGACRNIIPFTIKINKIPIVDNRADLEFCGGENYILTPMSVGSVGNYYTGQGGTIALLRAGEKITTTQKIYIYATTNSTPPCPVENYFTINFTPRVDILNPGVVCEKYILPVLSSGNYYTGPKATGTLLNAGDEIFFSQTIYIHNIFYNRNGPCEDESSFYVTVAKPILNVPPTAQLICDEDGINDGIRVISSTTLTDNILAGLPLTPDNYNVNYYNTSSDANAGINKITSIKTQNVYFKIYNIQTPTCFSKVGDVNVVVSKIPAPTPVGGFICVNKNNPITINSGIFPKDNTFEWYNNNGATLMPAETSSSLTVNIPDTYGVKVTNNLTNCSSKIITADVLASSPPTSIDFTTTEAFAENQIVTIIASGNGGDYEYQFDSSPFQDSPTFENISSVGEHIVTVRDKNGCGSDKANLTIINYPKYFTPNSDGYNDTWNIFGLKNQANSLVYIYDRYGKLLKQIKPMGDGWDGSYNGEFMPSSDYWFKVEYEENGTLKQFKSHFSLKR